MRARSAAILALLVLLPLGILAGLGWRLARSEAEALRARHREVLLGRLRDVDADIHKLLEARGRELLELTAGIADRPRAELLELQRGRPWVRQLFVLDPAGRMAYPPGDEAASAAERGFFERTGEIWRDRERFYRSDDDPRPPAVQTVEGNFQSAAQYFSNDNWLFFQRGLPQPQQTRQSGQVLVQAQEQDQQAQIDFQVLVTVAPPPRDHGWHAFYFGRGLQLLFWSLLSDGSVAGAEIERARLLADVIAELPAARTVDPLGQDGRIALVDAQGERIYDWGAAELGQGAEPVATLALSPPLAAWRLEFRARPGLLAGGPARAAWFNLGATLGAVALVLLGLAVYLHREQSRDLREAAQRVNFVNRVSHELRTPLTNVRMYAELLERELDEDQGRARSHLGIILAEGQRLTRLIGNVLDFGRRQRGELKLRLTPGSVDDVLGSVLEGFAPALAQHGIALRRRADASERVRLDADALEQILGNLLSNVEKYAPGGEASIESAQTGEITTVVVADQGPGVPPELAERIFEPFYRVSSALTDGVAGTGIGLTIARELARLHGGDLVLAPAPRGARFVLTLRTPAA